jgi:uroporphyrinogen-III synthase
VNPTVWVVASLDTATKWCDLLRERGLAAEALAWSEFHSVVTAAQLAQLRMGARPDVLLLTSANTVRSLPAEASWPVPVACVGEATAEAAREAGLDVRWVGARGAEQVAADLAAARPGCRVLFLRGRDARREGVDALEQAGCTVEEVIVYEMQRALGFPARVAEAPAPAAVVVGSPRAAEALAEALGTVARPGVGDRPVLAVGDTTAARLGELGFTDVRDAGHPSGRALADAVAAVL